MKVLHEQVEHRQFGIGSIIKQEKTLITVEFSEEYGTKLFQYPLAFNQFLIFCDDGLQATVYAKAHLMAEQIEAEQKRKEEESRHQEEERIKLLRQAATKKRSPAKKTSTKTSTKKTATKTAAKTTTKKATKAATKAATKKVSAKSKEQEPLLEEAAQG